MRKITWWVIALMITMVGFASCNSCGKTDEPDKVEASTDFNVLVRGVNKFAMAKYPTFAFYEAYANLSKDDSLAQLGQIDPSTLTVVYGATSDEITGTVMVTLDSLFNVKMNYVDDPWCEDMFTTPFVPLDLTEALNMLSDSLGYKMRAGTPVVLRHQLFYKEPEPRYFIGSIVKCHTVNVYTGTIDQPLAQPTQEWIDENKKNLKYDLDSIMNGIGKDF
jgi:uncharacterized ParB-like nuclease family protein